MNNIIHLPGNISVDQVVGVQEKINGSINGVPISTNNKTYFFGKSTTAASTVEKLVSIPSITELSVGQIIIVLPTVTSSIANSTLKLNDFNAYPMRYNNAAISTSSDSVVWSSAYPTIWLFDGDYWRFVAHGVDNNTTYGSMSVAEGTTGTATTARVITAAHLKDIIHALAPLSDWNATEGRALILNRPVLNINKWNANSLTSLNFPSSEVLEISNFVLYSGTYYTLEGILNSSKTFDLSLEEYPYYGDGEPLYNYPTQVMIMLTTGSSTTIEFVSGEGFPIYYLKGYEILPNTTYEIQCVFNGNSWVISSLELQKLNLFMYLDSFIDSEKGINSLSDRALENNYNSTTEYLENYLTTLNGGPKVYKYTGNMINYNNLNYYIWLSYGFMIEGDISDIPEGGITLLTSTIDYNTLYNHSMEANINNLWCPYVAMLQEDNTITYKESDSNDWLVKVEYR